MSTRRTRTAATVIGAGLAVAMTALPAAATVAAADEQADQTQSIVEPTVEPEEPGQVVETDPAQEQQIPAQYTVEPTVAATVMPEQIVEPAESVQATTPTPAEAREASVQAPVTASAARVTTHTVTALSAATGWGAAGFTTNDPANVAVAVVDGTTEITAIAWGGNCGSTGAPLYALDCDTMLIPAGAAVTTLVAGASAEVTDTGTIIYTPAPGWTGFDLLEVTDGARTTQVRVIVNAPTGAVNSGQELQATPSSPADGFYIADVYAIEAPAGVAYVTVAGLSGAVTGVQVFASGVRVVGPLNAAGGFDGGAATLTVWSLDGAASTVTVTAPATVTSPSTPQTHTVFVAPGATQEVDVLARAGLNPAELNGFELMGSTPDIAARRSADWTIWATLAPTTVPVDGSHDASWVSWRATLADGSTVEGTLYVSPQAEVTLQPATQRVLTWAGAPVTWDLTAGNEGTFEGDGLTAATSDWAVTPGPVTVNGWTAGMVAQSGDQVTFAPAPGWTGTISVPATFRTVIERQDGVSYATTTSTYVEVEVLGPVATGKTVSLNTGESRAVDLASDALWGSTADLAAYGDQQVSDGYTEQFGDEPAQWVDHPTDWDVLGTWTDAVESGAGRATSGTRLVVSTSGQADLGQADPVVDAELDAAAFAGTLRRERATATLSAATAQVASMPFALLTESGIRGQAATLDVTVVGGEVPSEPEPVTPTEPTPVDPAPVMPEPEPTEPAPGDPETVAPAARVVAPATSYRFETGVPAASAEVASLAGGSLAGIAAALAGAAGLVGLGLRRRRARQ
jgi:hypothetical protein